MKNKNIEAYRQFLEELIRRQAPPEGLNWLLARAEEIGRSGQDRTFYLTFSAVPRYLGKPNLILEISDVARADQLRPGFDPTRWTLDRAARVWLLLQLPHTSPDEFERKLEMLFDTADMGELVALYSSLPLLPYPERYRRRAAEGVRTNMTVVFDAVALDNPYPAEFLEESAWNQLFLKAAFLDRPLYRIRGQDERANPQLARIISDYAHERWAAGRVVSPEIWRSVAAFLDEPLLNDVRRLFAGENPLQREAAALLCGQSKEPEARKLLDEHPALRKKMENGLISWDRLARTWWREKEVQKV